MIWWYEWLRKLPWNGNLFCYILEARALSITNLIYIDHKESPKAITSKQFMSKQPITTLWLLYPLDQEVSQTSNPSIWSSDHNCSGILYDESCGSQHPELATFVRGCHRECLPSIPPRRIAAQYVFENGLEWEIEQTNEVLLAISHRQGEMLNLPIQKDHLLEDLRVIRNIQRTLIWRQKKQTGNDAIWQINVSTTSESNEVSLASVYFGILNFLIKL